MERQKRFSAESGKVQLAQFYYDVEKDGAVVGVPIPLPGALPNEAITFGSRTTCLKAFSSPGGTATVGLQFFDGETVTTLTSGSGFTMTNLNARRNVSNSFFEFTTGFVFKPPTNIYPAPRDILLRVIIGTESPTVGRLMVSIQYAMALSEAVEE